MQTHFSPRAASKTRQVLILIALLSTILAGCATLPAPGRFGKLNGVDAYRLLDDVLRSNPHNPYVSTDRTYLSDFAGIGSLPDYVDRMIMYAGAQSVGYDAHRLANMMHFATSLISIHAIEEALNGEPIRDIESELRGRLGYVKEIGGGDALGGRIAKILGQWQALRGAAPIEVYVEQYKKDRSSLDQQKRKLMGIYQMGLQEMVRQGASK